MICNEDPSNGHNNTSMEEGEVFGDHAHVHPREQGQGSANNDQAASDPIVISSTLLENILKNQ